jgi:antitoxin PrlF
MKLVTSTLTSKGQTTIPQLVRETLGIAANDRIGYEFVNGQVVLRPIRGNLLNLRGSVKPKRRPEDFKAIRRHVAKAVAKATVARG